MLTASPIRPAKLLSEEALTGDLIQPGHPFFGLIDVIRNTPAALRPFAPFVERVLPTLRVGQMLEINEKGEVTIIAPGR